MRTFSCDIETDGIDATRVWCIAVHNIDTDEVVTFSDTTLGLFKPWLESEVDRLIFHNGISFDVPVLESLMSVDFIDVCRFQWCPARRHTCDEPAIPA